MDSFRVVGGARLVGEVVIDGAKNSALKLMAAALLATGRTRLTNVPSIRDVEVMAELLRRLGCEVVHDGARGSVVIDVPETIGHRADYDLVRAMRASISVLGPLIARTGKADVAIPGGDAIGSRGLDLHASGLERLGASVHVDHGYLVAEAPNGLRGAAVGLDFPSVGATENILMASVLARGTTVIDNAAREPEIADITSMLIDMGARIEGIGGSTLVVEGVEELSAVSHRVVPDRIAAGTWAFAAATTRGDITIRSAEAGHLDLVLDKLARAGSDVLRLEDGFRVVSDSGPLKAIDAATLPYPGFPTDLQPFVARVRRGGRGSGMVTENLFEARFRTVQELARLGADVRVDGTTPWCTAGPGSGGSGRGQRHPGGSGAGHRGPGRRGRHDGERGAPRRPVVTPSSTRSCATSGPTYAARPTPWPPTPADVWPSTPGLLAGSGFTPAPRADVLRNRRPNPEPTARRS